MAKRKTDIPFNQDPASRLMPWIVAVMVYIAGLALAGAFVLSAFADRWESGLTGSLTIQIPPPSDEALSPDAQTQKVEAALDVLRGTKGVVSANALATEEMRRLLEPWLGQNIDPRDLPLPSLIAVELQGGLIASDLDLRDLRRRLDAVAPGVLIDDHGQWQERLVAFLGALRLVSAVLVAIVTAAGLIMVIFATRGGLLAHRQTIELLHLFGAQDGYVASQFAREAMKAGLKGGLFGVFATALTVIGLGQGAASTGAVLPGVAVLAPLDWAVLALLPLATALIAMIAARITVMRALARMV
ncbi:MAG TPA: hypothetical protein DCG04_08925 [Rhodospirillaceae bacterium]|nr:hypothetical protein [Rhodospirillaceae bacterium]MBB58482.1 hypothetical protein [Rhodospirillaceae bacterium]HAE01565.1 hypothetical protein [Rhodospirillaceae bacterium]|tara:strand:+ start:17104 stop:18006 length:903 start_codon:yes stop_codon:yes gene_type:complete